MSDIATEMLQANIGKLLYVKLSGSGYVTGRLKGFDENLNLVLEEAQDSNQNQLGLIILRGDNIRSLEPMPTRKE
jgi:small nuclear ribonucleoprotein